MANKTVLDFTVITTISGTDIAYIIRGVGADRDKQITIQNLLDSIPSAKILGTLNTDTINEFTTDNGVTIEGVLLKDSKIIAPIHWIRAEQVGNNLNIASNNPKVAALNGADIAFIDSSNDDLRTYRFNGTTWTQVGNDLVIATVGSSISITALNGTDIAFIDSGNDDLRTYRFDGTDWSQVGNDLVIATVGTPSIAALNGTDIAFIDETNENLRIYHFDGTDWIQVGNDLKIAGLTNLSITALNGTDIAFIDDTSDNLRTYRFAFSTLLPHSAVNPDF